jgi:hypothetical protein
MSRLPLRRGGGLHDRRPDQRMPKAQPTFKVDQPRLRSRHERIRRHRYSERCRGGREGLGNRPAIVERGNE